jgi:hypothetical protein
MKKTWEKFEEIKELMGADSLLDEICRGLSKDELHDALEYVDRMHDLGVFKDESEEE